MYTVLENNRKLLIKCYLDTTKYGFINPAQRLMQHENDRYITDHITDWHWLISATCGMMKIHAL